MQQSPSVRQLGGSRLTFKKKKGTTKKRKSIPSKLPDSHF